MTNIDEAVKRYRVFYASSTTVPFDADQNMMDYEAWRDAHDRLSEDEQSQAFVQYIECWQFGGRAK